MRYFRAIVIQIIFAMALFVPLVQANTLNVDNTDPSCSDTTGTPYCTLAAAVADAISDDTISVAAGTYNEGPQIVIDKNLTIDGEDRDTTILRPTADTGSSDDARGWFLVNSGITFDLSNLTMDGDGYLIWQAIRHLGTGTINNVRFTEIKFNESGPHYSGVAVAAFGTTGPVDVSNSIFTEIGRVGLLYFGSGVSGSTFQNNQYTGKGDGDFLDYALDISAGAVVDVSNNTITNNRGVASSDGSTSAGVLVTTLFGAGTSATLDCNMLTNNTTGVAAGYDETDTSTVVAHFNTLMGNTSYGIYTTNPVVDAIHNWWGDASGPSDNGPGTGDAVNEDITYNPWLAATPATTASYTGLGTFSVNDPVVLEVTLTDSSGGLDGATVEFFRNGTSDGSSVSNGDGIATLNIGMLSVGVYNIDAVVTGADCVKASAIIAVYDPSAGFVTGGGWIDSPPGAIPDPTISGVSSDTTVDPDAGYGEYYLRYVGNPPPSGYDPDHNYQWGTPMIVTPSPEDGPVTLQGTIDIDEQLPGTVAMIGLLDRDDLAAGNSSFQRGAYIYIHRQSATSWRIGPSDGNAGGGEIVQTFATIPDTDLPADGMLNVNFTVDGTADGTACASGTYTAPAGCMTLEITGGSVNAVLTDSYGDVVGNNSASPEFANGAVPGWDDYFNSDVLFPSVGYNLTVAPTTVSLLEGKATFGFVSKYKKGAQTPDGSTEFQFKAGDLNFHSDTYEWLVVNQGGTNAQFKGEGTINGGLDPYDNPYKFMLWAGDNAETGDPDTFRIKIWYENATEEIVYDNGSDQDIGAGNIVIHTGKNK